MKYLMSLFILIMISTTSYARYASVSTGIVPFFDFSKKNTSGQTSDIVLSELSGKLSKYNFIKLIERSRLKDVIKELELEQSGLVDETTAVKAGKIHGLQIMITGTIHPEKIYTRAIHMETQKVIGSYSVNDISEISSLADKLVSGIEVFLAKENLKSIRNDSPDIDLNFTIEGISDSGNVSIGKKIKFRFKSNANGYLTIVNIQPGGDVVILYPNDQHPVNEVKADKEYSIPSLEDSFDIMVCEPAGEDTIVFFFTKRKVDWLDNKKLTGQGFRTVKKHNELALSRGFMVKSTKLKSSEWESRSIIINVTGP